MRLLYFIILYLSYIGGVQAKDTPFSLVCKNVSTDSVFRQLRHIIGYDVFYASQIFRSSTTHTVNFKDGTLDKFMSTFLPHKKLVYEIRNNAIIITDVKYDTVHRHKFRYFGYVLDNYGMPLAYASISDNKNDLFVQTDSVGFFSFESEYIENSFFSFNHFAFDEEHGIKLLADDTNHIQLKRKVRHLDEVVIRGNMQQERRNVVSAISSMKFDRRFVNGSSVGDYLAGKSAGIIAVTRTGEPGKDYADIWVRGISTFGDRQEPLILVDGIEDDINMISLFDIDHLSILKDGAATAEFGIRGANGVILVETKRGRIGAAEIKFSQQFSISSPITQPNYVDGENYARLTNEARVVRGFSPIYSDEELKILKYGLDNDFYPNVDWQKMVFDKTRTTHVSHLSVQGGDDDFLYYMSGEYKKEDALFKTDNFDYKRFSLRTNLDYLLTPDIKLQFSGFMWQKKKIIPGAMESDDVLFHAIAKLNPLLIPSSYSNGLLAANSNEITSYSPYVLLNHTGNITDMTQSFISGFTFSHDLNRLIKGVSYTLKVNYRFLESNRLLNQKNPELYKATNRNTEGELITEKVTNESSNFQQLDPVRLQAHKVEYGINYSRLFADYHNFTWTIYAYLSEEEDETLFENRVTIPQRYMSLASRIMYNYKHLFFLEADYAYMGADNYQLNGNFTPFYSIALGVNLTSLSSVREYIAPIQHLKFRTSYGMMGNGVSTQTPTIFDSEIIEGRWGKEGIEAGYIDNKETVWERGTKFNIGMDITLGDELVDFTFDYFHNLRKGIAQKRYNLPQEVGNLHPGVIGAGQMLSNGFDLDLLLTIYKGRRSKFTINGSVTFTTNKITEAEDDVQKYSYQQLKGTPYMQFNGLLASGLFTDSLDILSSPAHTFGPVRPGDIKYKDINGDGKIDNDDIIGLGKSEIPSLMYGFGASVILGNFFADVWFTGTAKAHIMMEGEGVYPFVGETEGNVLVSVLNDRWISAWYSGDINSENPQARYPRLTWGKSNNNGQASSFWLKNAGFLKLKSINIGYKWDDIHITESNLAIELIMRGHNLMTFSKFKDWDPEQVTPNGAIYPLQRTFTIDFNVIF